ncbi:patatin-like protein 2 isoform X1 [Senna tora]|uniref:Patatin-like protein 2 isoform X1 n=1 Tax=Senna tora TaxID=362788 RepID=A0A834W0Z9_9FABA|nr:patatin-like protein 2 isoform X1 [Senna tora]
MMEKGLVVLYMAGVILGTLEIMSTALVLGQYNSMHNFLPIQDDTLTLDPKEVNVNLNDASKKNIDALELEEGIERKLLQNPISMLNPQPTNKEAIT